jgi:fumarate hydratase class II
MLATPLAVIVGYDKAAEVAKKAHQENKSIREVAQELLAIPEKQLAEILDPSKMVRSQKKK